MGLLRSVSPASLDDCLEAAGSRALARKALIWQREKGDSLAIFDDDELVAVAFLVPMEGRLEFCLALRAGARARMLPLCRYAHLTLSRLAETGAVITCHVWAGNTAGQRMARLVGFSPDQGTLWRWAGHGEGRQGTVRRGR
jgi:hypothetical protein